MSDDAQSPPDHLREMAAQIYMQLVNGQVAVSDTTVKIATNPESLAKVSFKLAEAFQAVERERHASAAPVSAKLDLDKLDFGAHTTK